MSDETTRTDGWATADASSTEPGEAKTGSEAGAARPVGFCQDCGRPLTPETLRTVGKGVFCEPCLETRLGQGPAGGYAAGATPGPGATQGYGAQGYGAQGYGAAQGYGGAQPGYGTVPPPVAPLPSEPSPALAGLLGLIPGVGAMYNGQFAKGIAHLIVFVLLDLVAENVSGIFWIFVWGWIFYQSFEAYHTAKARLEGLPLPNAFGFNDIGERMGFGKSWGPTAGAGRTTAAPPATPWTTTGTATPPVPPAASPTAWAVPPAAGPDWVGYVPPTAFAQADARQRVAALAAQQAAAQPMPGPAYAPPMYAETFTGVPPVDIPAPVAAQRRFPVGAIWLIGLGGLILLANVVPDWRISDRWWPPVLFAGLSLWVLTRRLHTGARMVCILRWPVILMVLAVLSALHAAYVVVTFGMTCAVLLIAFGVLLLVERTLGAGPGYGAAAGYSAAGYGTAAVPQPSAESTRATFTTAGPAVVGEASAANDEPKGEPKGGQ